jgi:glycosyltransferase involved in cell wall biosynthesis
VINPLGLIRRTGQFVQRTIRYVIQPLAKVNNGRGQRPTETVHIDVTRIAESDIRTGVQRVVRQISRQWLERGGRTFDLNFVRVNHRGEIVNARNWAAQLAGEPSETPLSEPTTVFQPGDFLFLLDLVLPPRGANRSQLRHLQQNGIRIICMIYDILPLTHPFFFPLVSRKLFKSWFKKVMCADQILTISESTKRAIEDIFRGHSGPRVEVPPIAVIPMSGEPEQPEAGGIGGDTEVIPKPAGELFVCIGTVEPRKGYDEVFDTFQGLWADGSNASLWVFGKPGWKTKLLQRRFLEEHNRNSLFRWFPLADDHVVRSALTVADCLIISSHAEGLGLPLLEARHLGAPVLARDISVFREIGDTEVFFFSSDPGGSSLGALLRACNRPLTPSSNAMVQNSTTWQDTVNCLEELLSTRPFRRCPSRRLANSD